LAHICHIIFDFLCYFLEFVMIEQKKKLRLDELQVESFVTSETGDVKGGIFIGSDTTFIIPICAPFSGWPLHTQCAGCQPAGSVGCPPPPPYTEGASCQVCETIGQPGCDTVVGQLQCP
jgi:hypothetical protein